jgi:hypothetical protein
MNAADGLTASYDNIMVSYFRVGLEREEFNAVNAGCRAWTFDAQEYLKRERDALAQSVKCERRERGEWRCCFRKRF